MSIDRLLELIRRLRSVEPGRGLGEPGLLVRRLEARNQEKPVSTRLFDRSKVGRSLEIRSFTPRGFRMGPNAPLLMRIVKRPLVIEVGSPSRGETRRARERTSRVPRTSVISIVRKEKASHLVASPARDRYVPLRAMREHVRVVESGAASPMPPSPVKKSAERE